MAIYHVQQKASTWIEAQVEADTEAEALELGKQIIAEGGGIESFDNFEWLDSYWLGDENHNTLQLEENE